MIIRRLSVYLCLISTFVISQFSVAANTAAVFGPIVNPDDRSVQYRFGFSPSENDDGIPRQIRHRIHYQHSINEDFRWRIIAQFGDTGSEMRFENVGAELLWHFKKRNTDKWDSGLRFDIRSARGGRQIYGLDWTNEWKLSAKWQVRALALLTWQSGNNANSGTAVSTRFNALYKMRNGHKIGIEMFNNYGRYGRTGSFDDQSHQIGPVLSGKLNGFSYQLGYLNGISDGTDDHDLRFWLGKSF